MSKVQQAYDNVTRGHISTALTAEQVRELIASLPYAKEWVRKLRSGEYNQIQGTLKNTLGYCCLGVYLDIAEPECLNRNVDMPSDSGSEDKVICEIQEFFAELNDKHKYTFEEIAEVIEDALT